MNTPANVYVASDRSFPEKLQPFEYPDRFEVRYVSTNGGVRWKGRRVCVSHIIAGQYIGFEEVDENRWDVFYGPLCIGRFHEDKLRIEDAYGKLKRRNRKY